MDKQGRRVRRSRAAYITVGGSRVAEGGGLQIQSESWLSVLIVGSQNGSVSAPELVPQPPSGRSAQRERAADERVLDMGPRWSLLFAFLGRAPPVRRKKMVTPGKSLESEGWACSWRGAGLEDGQPGDGGQLDHAAVGLDERDAEQARAAAFCAGRLTGFRSRWRRLVT